MDVTTFHGLWTLALLVAFVAIVVWAWSAKRKKHFDEAARIPLDDEDRGEAEGAAKRKEDG